MGDLFRSEKMVLCQLFVQAEGAYYILAELGELGIVQFEDLNETVNLHSRKFVGEVRRCENMEINLRFIKNEIRKNKIPIPPLEEVPKTVSPKEMFQLEAKLVKTAESLRRLIKNTGKLKSDYETAKEMKTIWEKTDFLLKGREAIRRESLLDYSSIPSGTKLDFVVGSIDRAHLLSFERMLWRIFRRNVLLKCIEVSEIRTESATEKVVFVLFFQGQELKTRIFKVCSGFRANVYPYPRNIEDKNTQLININDRLTDLRIILAETSNHQERFLINTAKDIERWTVYVMKMKAIYHVLNFFTVDVVNKYLIGEVWVPESDIQLVQQAFVRGSKEARILMPSYTQVMATDKIPPTYNKTNKFTKGFQNLIDSYGIANYQEANPALYTIVTFPFLFAVMFGDVGHGLILLTFGIYLVAREKSLVAKKNTSEIFAIFFAGRYIILLMGLFSIYTGFIYNDFFCKSMNIFGSSWFIDLKTEEVLKSDVLSLDPAVHFKSSPYVVGIDPVWNLAQNSIVFLNSFKMKVSIVLGVFHMMFGVCVGVINLIHFKKYPLLFLEFLPQITFLCCLFLWLVIMIFLKWTMYSADKHKDKIYGSSCAPSVLILFINMMLFKNTEPAEGGCKAYIFDNQDHFQKFLLLVAVLCVPVLLFGKPVVHIINARRKTRVSKYRSLEGEESRVVVRDPHKKEEPLSDVFVYQAIHTIEYVLGTVSHTASYLRLWALSLAHSQLSEVLWNRVLRIGLQGRGPLGIFAMVITFGIWACFTLIILVVMEGLSAFLHTLRLHWVEFMSKFYTGTGHSYIPFSFEAILQELDNEVEVEVEESNE